MEDKEGSRSERKQNEWLEEGRGEKRKEERREDKVERLPPHARIPTDERKNDIKTTG